MGSDETERRMTMPTTTTTTITPTLAACNGDMSQGGVGVSHDMIRVAVTYPAGIYGGKKRCLYLLLILLVSVVVINMALTVWLIKILDLSSEGMGRMFITEDGIAVASNAEFLSVLSARQIISNQHSGLKLESSRNVTILAKDGNGRITNILSLGEAGLQSIGNYFSVRGKEGDVLLHVNSEEMIVAASRMEVKDSGGLRLDGSLQTPLVRGGATKDLRLESPLKTVSVKGNEELQLESPAGGIYSSSLRDMRLNATGGTVSIESARMVMKNLKESSPTHRESRFQTIYQVCTCENGRVFLAHREGLCQINQYVCQDSPPKKQPPVWGRS